MNSPCRPSGLAVENFPALPEKAVQPAWHLNELKCNVFCCKHLICSFWTVWVTRSNTSVKCPEQCLSAVSFFYSSCSKSHWKGGKKKTHTGFPPKHRKAQSWQPLATEWMHATDYRPFVSWLQQTPGELVLALNSTSFSPESLLLTAPPRVLAAQSPGDSDLLSMWVLVCLCVLNSNRASAVICLKQ